QDAERTGPVIKLGGPSVDNVAIDEEGQITLVRLVGLSLLVGLGLSYFSFRSINVTIMVFLVGGLSALASLSFVYWGGTTVDAVLMSMPSLIYVLGLSGAVHIVNYYRDSVAVDGLKRAPGAAVSHGWKPCTLAAITTALGLISLLSSNIQPIRKFGLYSAIGVLATLVLLFTYLPAALQTWPPRRFVRRKPGAALKSGMETLIERMWRRIGTMVIDNYVLVMGAMILLMCGVGYGIRKIDTDVQLLKMFDSEAKIIRDYTWLEKNLGKLVPMEIIVRIDEKAYQGETSDMSDSDEAVAANDDVENAAENNSTDAIAQHPLSFLERMEVVSYIEEVLSHRFGETGQQIIGNAMSPVTFAYPLPKPGASFRQGSVRGGISRRLAAHRDEFLRSDYLRVDPVDDAELWRISLRLGALNNVDYGAFVHDLQDTVEPVLAAYKYRTQILSALAAQRGDQGIRNAKVYLVGVPFLESKTAKIPAPESPGNANPGDEPNWSDTAVFAKILARLLINAGVNLRDWHDPRYELPDNWGALLEEQDCVVVVDPRGPYDLTQVQNRAKSYIDARHHSFESLDGTANQRHEAISAIYTGLVPVVYKAQRTLLDSLIVSTIWAFVMIAGVMMLVVRNVRAGLISMLPNVFPVLLIFGFMGWSGTLV
ncbi:MAG: MMPL family transporter, partial [Planctomycetales bacterium]|nr:MMPL family transporter [Planctomycetales bacterium]